MFLFQHQERVDLASEVFLDIPHLQTSFKHTVVKYRGRQHNILITFHVASNDTYFVSVAFACCECYQERFTYIFGHGIVLKQVVDQLVDRMVNKPVKAVLVNIVHTR